MLHTLTVCQPPNGTPILGQKFVTKRNTLIAVLAGDDDESSSGSDS